MTGLQIGKMAPNFEAIAVFENEFSRIKLSDYLDRKFVILLFYPLNFTFVCPTELTAFSDRFSEFNDLNTEVLGVSVDSEYSHLSWLGMDRDSGGLGKLNYPLISDLKKEISRSFNVLTDEGVALRGLFIIDKQGIVQHATVNNSAFGRSVDEALRVLQAIQYIQDKPEEVCPADWKPGSKTIIPDPVNSKKYFSAVNKTKGNDK